MATKTSCVGLLTGILLALLWLVLETVGSGRQNRRGHLPHPSFLNIPEVFTRISEQNLLYTEQPLKTWTILEIDNRATKQYYCPEIIYMTLDIRRQPQVMPHRKCNNETLGPGKNCLSSGNMGSSLLCKDQLSYQIVKVDGRDKYQEVYIGCGCDATGQYAG